MRKLLNYALAGVLLLCASSAALADTLKSDYDHGVDFSKYHTYSWGKVTTANPFYVDRVKETVNRLLQEKGWRLVASGGDATIFAHDRVHNEQELETSYMGMGGGWGGGWGWGGWGGMGGMGDMGEMGGMGGMGGMGNATTDTVDVRVGRLVLDIFDGKSKTLLWRGSSTEDLSDNSGKNSKKLAGDIAKLFKKFPPTKK